MRQTYKFHAKWLKEPVSIGINVKKAIASFAERKLTEN
jgi:hypothetical protein